MQRGVAFAFGRFGGLFGAFGFGAGAFGFEPGGLFAGFRGELGGFGLAGGLFAPGALFGGGAFGFLGLGLGDLGSGLGQFGLGAGAFGFELDSFGFGLRRLGLRAGSSSLRIRSWRSSVMRAWISRSTARSRATCANRITSRARPLNFVSTFRLCGHICSSVTNFSSACRNSSRANSFAPARRAMSIERRAPSTSRGVV